MKISIQFFGGRGSSSAAGGNTQANFSAERTQSFLQGELDKHGIGNSKEAVAEKVYTAAKTAGMNISILNGKYLAVQGANGEIDFSFNKSKVENKWKLVPMLGYNDVTKGRHYGQVMYRAAGEWFARKSDAEQAFVKSKLG